MLRYGGLAMIIVSMLLAPAAGASPAATLKGLLLSPGDLSAAHADLTDKCESCHAQFKRGAQDNLCLDCHTRIEKDLASHEGFHGRLAVSACNQCHSEHLGRDADITGLDVDRFHHADTGFSLKGAHASLACEQCHNDSHREKGKMPGKFRLTGTACKDCHSDLHRGRLEGSCDSCHTTTEWQKTNFDHDTTRFKLRDKHARLLCQACHKDKGFEAPTACIDCHKADDVHQGEMGADCGSCHASSGWRQVSFDHATTRFPLHGAHASLACDVCHTQQGNQFEHLFNGHKPVAGLCSDCHARDDLHEGSFGQTCQKCHNESSWRDARFDHDKTAFPLLGEHRQVACDSCHAAGKPVNPGSPRTQCIDCHRSDDAHGGALGEQCEQCHSVKASWQSTTFDHDFSSFPLTGAHHDVSCAGCHPNRRFDAPATTCAGCHQVPDIHKDVFTGQCSDCHTTRDWRAWQFDHSTTAFSLTGAHTRAACLDCHRANLQAPLQPGRTCFACHAADDVHHRQFGQRCEACHNTSTFKDATVSGRTLH